MEVEYEKNRELSSGPRKTEQRGLRFEKRCGW